METPYNLPSALLHSFYPPNLQRVPAETLPHIIVNGAVPREREPDAPPQPEEEEPLPWLALLLFKDDSELVVPLEVVDATHVATGTRSIRLPPSTVAAKFGGRHTVSHPEELGDAEFIFLQATIFKSYFEDQTKPDNTEQDKPDLSRYKHLVHVKEVGVGPSGDPIKVSTVLAHRIRPPAPGPPQKMIAHLVSLEGVSNIAFKETANADAVFALVSLCSWGFEWDTIGATEEHDIFKELQAQVQPLRLSNPTPVPENASTAQKWIRAQVDNGYTMVRHRGVTGETSMALFRGPLVPALEMRAQIRPSMYGTDLQVLDAETEVLDVSYSKAWDLGRSVAAREPQFSRALATVRRRLFLLATTSKAPDGSGSGTAVPDEVDEVLGKLAERFKGGVSDKLAGVSDKGSRRWVMEPSAKNTELSAAELQRNLAYVGKTFVKPHVIELATLDAAATPKSVSIEGMREVIEWVMSNIFSLKMIPAQYLFPDPAVLAIEHIMAFFIDDNWIDSMVDGALSLGNTVGGTVDAVRDEIRQAINVYIKHRRSESLQIARQGFVIRSGCIEALPDLQLKPEAAVVLSTRNQDMLMCLFDPDKCNVGEKIQMELSQPPHQVRFGVTKLQDGLLEQSFPLEAFRKDATIVITGLRERTWKKIPEPQTTPELLVSVLNFDTGILMPAELATAHANVAKEVLGQNFQPLDDNSKSVYLAAHLNDRPSSLNIQFEPSQGRSSSSRQLFPDQTPVSV
ncbi:hypothetical protein G7Z17_g2325 [Cylindrodendrum hubeiense]|uniref:Uncharacterized protein n=1 Tax=Cylindrodendrum hubeiense TaxID=595255 RepID=A0A9P5HL21_9HYPO|nr:hypothetical protein G7Z17_g2325 [Cylindrodendrum hubeiense]